VSVLARKARRDLLRQRWQYLSVAITIAIGLMLFAASHDAFQNLKASYNRTYERLAFADLTVTGGDSGAFAERARAAGGVAAVTTRRQADVPVRIARDHKLLGRIVELPPDGDPEVNKVDLLRGSLPAPGAGDVLIERHMADHFELGPGDSVELIGRGRWRAVTVAGVVASPEYLWPARSRQDILTSLDDFGVIFAPASVLDRTDAAPVSQVLVRAEPGAQSTALLDRLRGDALDLGAGSIESRDDQASNAALQEDVAAFGELSFLFPVLFLGAAAMATFVMLGRVVRAQRSHIATLLANGLGARRIAAHYLFQGIVVTGVAGLAGLALGVPLGRLSTGLYTDALSIPDTVTGFHGETVLIGLGLALVTGVAAAAAPALAAARTPPGRAMRGDAPPRRGGKSLLERAVPAVGRLPARWLMVLRGIGRSKRRSLSTVLGVVLALVLILASWGMVDTVDILVDRQFNEVQRQDAQVYLSSAGVAARGEVEAVPGVERAEPVAQAPATVRYDGRQYATQLIAFPPDTEMHDFGGEGLPPEGVVVGRSLESILGVERGDVVTIAVEGAATTAQVPIADFADEPLGTFAYLSLAAFEDSFGAAGSPSMMVTFSEGADPSAMRELLSGSPGVVGYVDSRALYDATREYLGLFYAFVGVMLVFGGIMAFALIFNTSSVNVAERSPELAALRVNGASAGQLARLLAGENLLLAGLGIAPGLLVGYGVSALFMDSFSSDLFDFGLEMRASTLALSAAAIVIVTALAQWPVTRSVANLDVARVVRERSQ
jgi:putative ABC transport system permease protein